MTCVYLKRNPLRLLCDKGNEVTVADYLTGHVSLSTKKPDDLSWREVTLDEAFYREVYEAALQARLLPNIVVDPKSTYEERLKQIMNRHEILQGHYIVCTNDLAFYCTAKNDVTGIMNILRGESKPHWFTTSAQARLALEIVKQSCPAVPPIKWTVLQLDGVGSAFLGKLGAPLVEAGEAECRGCRGCQSTCDAAY